MSYRHHAVEGTPTRSPHLTNPNTLSGERHSLPVGAGAASACRAPGSPRCGTRRDGRRLSPKAGRRCPPPRLVRRGLAGQRDGERGGGTGQRGGPRAALCRRRDPCPQDAQKPAQTAAKPCHNEPVQQSPATSSTHKNEPFLENADEQSSMELRAPHPHPNARRRNHEAVPAPFPEHKTEALCSRWKAPLPGRTPGAVSTPPTAVETETGTLKGTCNRKRPRGVKPPGKAGASTSQFHFPLKGRATPSPANGLL